MAQCIFVVEEATRSIKDPGVMLLPFLYVDPLEDIDKIKQSAPARLRAQPCPVVLRCPDGTTLACTLRKGSIQVSGVNPGDPLPYGFYWLPDIQADQVPPGTEVWVEEADILSPEEIRDLNAAFMRERAERKGE